MVWVEGILSILMGTIGAYLMYRGKKIQQPKMILWGGVLIVLSYFLFSAGGKDDDASKAALKMMVPSAAATEPAQ
ncbi:MAG TPA: hypothetical protein VMU88_09535 [bacterium]|nr:hypothetical protein [bacterium]